MILQRATIEDAAEILALQKLAFQCQAELYDDFDMPPMVQTLDGMREDLREKLVLKAVIDGEIVGSVRAHAVDGTCHVGRLIVHPHCQNRGLGTQLMEALETAFDQVARFELFTGHKSVRPLHLYRKLGYRIFKRKELRPDYVLVYMEKNISQEADPIT